MPTFPHNLPNDDTPVSVTYDFFPAERQTHNHPGCEAHVQIIEVTCADGFVVPLDGKLLGHFEEIALEHALEVREAVRAAGEEYRAEQRAEVRALECSGFCD